MDCFVALRAPRNDEGQGLYKTSNVQIPGSSPTMTFVPLSLRAAALRPLQTTAHRHCELSTRSVRREAIHLPF